MIEKVKQLAGKCPVCGREHTLITSELCVGEDATDRLIAYIRAHSGRTVVVCDENTAKYAAVIQAGAGCDCLTFPGDAHATEITSVRVREYAGTDTVLLVACGSGSIHDTVRHAAHEAGIPFVSYPTAASVDGFVSGVAAMTWYGQKLTFPSTPPVALFADERVYAEAPARLTASGAADILGKFTSLADWRAGQILTGEAVCERIYNLEKEALDDVAYAVLHRSEYDALRYTKLIMNALILSGLTIQLWGNSRPCSGAEHHLSHFWEMALINGESDGLHGEQVGVGLLYVLDSYKKFAARTPMLTDSVLCPDVDQVMERTRLAGIFGDLTDGILAENMPSGRESSSLCLLSSDNRAEKEQALRALIDSLPAPQDACEMLRACGAPTSLGEIALPDSADFVSRTLAFAPYARNRLSLLKLIAADALMRGE